jgi:hypothetical protein
MTAPTLTEVADYVGTSPAEPTLPGLLSVAVKLVDDHLGATGRERCPEEVHKHAITQLVSELWTRRNAPGGVAQWTPDGAPLRLARDSLVAVRPLLDPYRGLGVVG